MPELSLNQNCQIAVNVTDLEVAEMSDYELWMAFFEDPSGNLLALMSEIPYDE